MAVYPYALVIKRTNDKKGGRKAAHKPRNETLLVVVAGADVNRRVIGFFLFVIFLAIGRIFDDTESLFNFFGDVGAFTALDAFGMNFDGAIGVDREFDFSFSGHN